jgi:hypothetical protein
MCIFFIFFPAALLACVIECLIDRPRRPKVYRKRHRYTFN